MFDGRRIDQAYINGSVITVDDAHTIASAVGIKGDRIVFVGSTEELLRVADPDTVITDLAGRTLMPGINDCHFHPILNGMLGTELDSAMLDTTKKNCPTLRSMLDLVRRVAAEKKPGAWISMMGYEPMLFEDEQRHPTIEELDEAGCGHPVHCMHLGGHICMYNHKALEYLGVYDPEDAKKYPDGEVVVENGKLTGLVRGHTHFWLWGQVEYTEAQQMRAAMKSHQLCIENGITSVGDMGECDAPSYHIMQKLCKNGTFKVRSYMALHSIFGKRYSLEDNDHWMKLGFVTGLGDEHFRVGPCKFMIDGGAGAPSCAVRAPYSHDPALPYEIGWEREETARYIEQIQAAECQATSHAIGDLAVEYMVEGYERCFAKDPDRTRALRHRIEHCTLVDPDLIARIARLGVIPTINPGMITQNGAVYEKHFGPERTKYMMALRSFLDAGVPAAIASDAPSGPVGLATLDGAVNRYDRMKGFAFSQNQRIGVLEAIRCMTRNGAYASFEEDRKGSIETGKLADLAILSGDVLAVDPMAIPTLKVDRTVIGGETVFNRGTLSDVRGGNE